MGNRDQAGATPATHTSHSVDTGGKCGVEHVAEKSEFCKEILNEQTQATGVNCGCFRITQQVVLKPMTATKTVAGSDLACRSR